MADTPLVPIIMNAPGFMVEEKHNRYLTDEELDAILNERDDMGNEAKADAEAGEVKQTPAEP